jgi:formate dehydrogenase subunit gamma
MEEKMKKETRVVLKFSKAQRIVHWTFAISFLVLAFTGLTLMFAKIGILLHIPWLAKVGLLASGGYTRMIHRLFAVSFAIAPVIYFFADREGLKELIKDSFTYDEDDKEWVKPKYMLKNYFFGKAKGLPPQGRITGGERFHHAVIIFVYFIMLITGVLLVVGQGNFSTTVFNLVVMLHDIGMVLGMMLTAGHIYFTFTFGVHTIVTKGWVAEETAKIENIKWYNKVKDTHVRVIEE